MATYIAHSGILGMKWGVRRYQNKDGSLTEAGKQRYSDTKKESSLSEKKTAAQRVHEMSDDDLNAALKRLRNEREFLNLQSEVAKYDVKSKTLTEKTLEKFRDKLIDEAVGTLSKSAINAVNKALFGEQSNNNNNDNNSNNNGNNGKSGKKNKNNSPAADQEYLNASQRIANRQSAFELRKSKYEFRKEKENYRQSKKTSTVSEQPEQAKPNNQSSEPKAKKKKSSESNKKTTSNSKNSSYENSTYSYAYRKAKKNNGSTTYALLPSSTSGSNALVPVASNSLAYYDYYRRRY